MGYSTEINDGVPKWPDGKKLPLPVAVHSKQSLACISAFAVFLNFIKLSFKWSEKSSWGSLSQSCTSCSMKMTRNAK